MHAAIATLSSVMKLVLPVLLVFARLKHGNSEPLHLALPALSYYAEVHAAPTVLEYMSRKGKFAGSLIYSAARNQIQYLC